MDRQIKLLMTRLEAALRKRTLAMQMLEEAEATIRDVGEKLARLEELKRAAAGIDPRTEDM